MCGIFGAIGRGFDPQVVISLAIANQARGKDSLGFVCEAVDGPRIWKKKGEPLALFGKIGLLQVPAMLGQHVVRIGAHPRGDPRQGLDPERASVRIWNISGYPQRHRQCAGQFEVDSQYLWHLLAN